jgi:regulatory protein
LANNEEHSAPDYLRAEEVALRLITRAEQSSVNLTRKLERRGFDSAAVSAVISNLIELNLLNDRRYAQLWIESRLRLARSPLRLLSALCARGIDRDDAASAMKAVLDEETELSLLARFAGKMKKQQKKGGDTVRSLKYLLKSEGFSAEAIQRYLDEQD